MKKLTLAFLLMLGINFISCGDDSTGTSTSSSSTNQSGNLPADFDATCYYRIYADARIECKTMSNSSCIQNHYLNSVKMFGAQLVLYSCQHADSVGLSPTDVGLSSSSQTSANSPWCDTAGHCGTFTDSRDGQTYSWTKIGNQVWMAQNLNYGTQVDLGSQAALHIQVPGEKFCYDNHAASCDSLGGLYQWHIAWNMADSCLSKKCEDLLSSQIQGICPKGWHMPKTADWDTLTLTLKTIQSPSLGLKIKATNTSWTDWNNAVYNSGNPYAFGAIPAGYTSVYGKFNSLGIVTGFWREKEATSSAISKYFYLQASSSQLQTLDIDKRSAMSVRCIKD